MKKILVLGSRGMIGHQVYNYLEKCNSYILYNCVHNIPLNDQSILIDLRDEKALTEHIERIQPDYIVNCAGVLIESSDKDLENAIFINSYLPNHLKNMGDCMNFKLIQISTDCVFSGDRGNYSENDFPDGTSNYSRTKSLGEINDPNHLTLRTSVIGPELKADGHELFHWFMMQNAEINGFTAAFWSGVTTLEFAKVLRWAIDENISGIYNVTNGIPINKYDLLCLLKKATGKDIVVNPIPGRNTNKTLVDTRNKINYQLPSYYVMISEMVEMIRKNRKIYRQYNII